MVTRTPAEELGTYNHTGSLTAGKLADITILDRDLSVRATIVSGQMVYQSKQ
jgi:N-acetylglucosamine-6-phosphate deacetylase